MNPLSFWEQDAFSQPYDLVVVGAGIVGLSSALFHKKDHSEAEIAVIGRVTLFSSLGRLERPGF